MTQPEPLEPQVSGEAIAVAGLLAMEAAFATAVLAAYTAWLREVSAAIFAVLPINPTIIWSLIPSWERRVRTLMTQLARIAEQGWIEAARQLDVPAIGFDITNPVLQDQLRRTRNFMVNTPNEVYMMILRALDQNAGDQGAQVAAVRNILDITGTVNWPARSRTVAVTEVNRAFHMGSLAMAMNVPGRVQKQWQSREDSATRPTHAEADLQIRPVGQPFLVGTSALMIPGDPSGPPHEVINCRCAVGYRRIGRAS